MAGTDLFKRVLQRSARPVLRKVGGIRNRFDRLDDQIEQSTHHLAQYIGKVERELYELRTQVAVDVEVIAELARALRRVVTEVERLVPDLRSLTEQTTAAAARAEESATRIESTLALEDQSASDGRAL